MKSPKRNEVMRLQQLIAQNYDLLEKIKLNLWFKQKIQKTFSFRLIFLPPVIAFYFTILDRVDAYCVANHFTISKYCTLQCE